MTQLVSQGMDSAHGSSRYLLSRRGQSLRARGGLLRLGLNAKSRWVVLGLLLGASGCALQSVAREKHASFHGCASEDVTSSPVTIEGVDYVQTEGCGATETFRCIGAKCRSRRLLAIRQFSNDVGCKREGIEAVEKAGAVRVSGCARSATYDCRDDSKQLIRCQRRP